MKAKLIFVSRGKAAPAALQWQSQVVWIYFNQQFKMELQDFT
jgi:hypothetical protein